MKEVYTARDQEVAYMVRDLLLARGFDVLVRGELLVGFGLRRKERYPSVWVKQSEDFDRAREVVEEFLRVLCQIWLERQSVGKIKGGSHF